MKLVFTKAKNIQVDFLEELTFDIPNEYIVIAENGNVLKHDDSTPIGKLSVDQFIILLHNAKNNPKAVIFNINLDYGISDYYLSDDGKILIWLFFANIDTNIFTIKQLAESLDIIWKEADKIVAELQNKNIVERFHTMRKITPEGMILMNRELKAFYAKQELTEIAE